MSLPSGENLRDWQCYLGSEMYYARRFTVPHSSPQQTFFVFFPTKTRLLFVTTFSMSSRRCGGFTWRQCDEPDPSPTQAPEGESQPEKEETEEKKETPEVAPLSLSSNISCWELLWASISRSFVVTIIHLFLCLGSKLFHSNISVPLAVRDHTSPCFCLPHFAHCRCMSMPRKSISSTHSKVPPKTSDSTCGLLGAYGSESEVNTGSWACFMELLSRNWFSMILYSSIQRSAKSVPTIC